MKKTITKDAAIMHNGCQLKFSSIAAYSSLAVALVITALNG